MPNSYNKQIKINKSKVLGYKVFCDSGHPLVNSGGWLYYHRHVASVKEGRWLTADEHVHHVDGDKTNNTPSNLEILSKQEHIHKHMGYRRQYACKLCTKLSLSKHFCSQACAHKATEKIAISNDELSHLVWTSPMSTLSSRLGISDVAIKKRCKKNGIATPPYGYWNIINNGGTKEEALQALEDNKNRTSTPPKFNQEQLQYIILELNKGELSMRDIGEKVGASHHPVMRINKHMRENTLDAVYTYYKIAKP